MSLRCARPRERERGQKEVVRTFGVAGNGVFMAAADRTPAIDSGGLGAQSERGREGKERREDGFL